MKVIEGSTVICIFFFLFSLVPVAAEEFQPARLIDSQEWRVSVRYPSALGDGSWSDPDVWRYVSRKTETGWVISGTPDPAEGNDDRIEIRTDDALKFQEVRICRQAGSSTRTRIVRAGNGPVLTERSPAPFDRPVFPLEVPSKRTYRQMITLGEGLQAETTVTQEAHRMNNETAAGLSGAASRGEDIIEVILTDDRGTVLVVQYWCESHPWPLAGSNRSMRYQLVDTVE